MGVRLDGQTAEQFEQYAELLAKWSSAINLTTVTEPREVAVYHFLDSLTALRAVKPGSSVLDIGAGAGFPGLPLKICMPSINLVLADSREKKVFFMREVIRKLGIKGARAVKARVGAGPVGAAPRFDIAVSRAAGKAPDIVRAALPLVKEGGIVLIMKGKNGAREWEREKPSLPRALRVAETMEEITLPVGGDKRFLLTLKKER